MCFKLSLCSPLHEDFPTFSLVFFFLNDPAPPKLYPLPLPAALPIPHRHFHDDLSELKAKLLTMSGEAQDALGRALDALLRRDADLAARTIAGDHAVDALELEKIGRAHV